MSRHITLSLRDDKQLDKIATALYTSTRRKILAMLSVNSYSLVEIAEALNLSVSNISFHVKLLKDAGLVNITANPSKRGNVKIVALEKLSLLIRLEEDSLASEVNSRYKYYATELPVGSFSNLSVRPPCGIADKDGVLLEEESLPDIFYSFKRIRAEIVWLTGGYLEYCIPNYRFKNCRLQSVELSMELCSECSNYNDTYKSDITFWLNDTEVATYTSPGDFGGRPGRLNPPNWSVTATQYGLLVQLAVTREGTRINNAPASPVSTEDVAHIATEECVRLRIGIKDGARHGGGFNLFGKAFGDYPQGIRFSVSYLEEEPARSAK